MLAPGIGGRRPVRKPSVKKQSVVYQALDSRIPVTILDAQQAHRISNVPFIEEDDKKMIHFMNTTPRKNTDYDLPSSSRPPTPKPSTGLDWIPFAEFASDNDIVPRYNRIPVDDSPLAPKRWEVLLESFKRHLRSAAPSLGLIVFILISAFIIMNVERAYGQPDSDLFASNVSFCIGHPINDYWAAIIYVDGLATAVGMGGITTCTPLGKFLSVVCTLIGVPLSLIVLNQIGGSTSKILHVTYIKSRRQYRSMRAKYIKSTMPKDIDEKQAAQLLQDDEEDEELLDVPISFGVGLTVGWMCFCSAVFSSDRYWPYGEASYFSFMMLTVGVLTDVTSFHWPLGLFTMIAIFFGLAFISNMINIIQTNIEHLVTRVERKIEAELKAALADDSGTGESPEERIQRILKETKAPAWMANMIPQQQMSNQLTKTCEKMGDLINMETQTDPPTPEPTPRVPTPPPVIEYAQRGIQCNIVDPPIPTLSMTQQTSPTQSSDNLTQTFTVSLSDQEIQASTMARSVSVHAKAPQTDAFTENELEYRVPRCSTVNTICTTLIPASERKNSEVQVAPTTRSISVSNYTGLQDFACSARPSTRTVITQFPKRWALTGLKGRHEEEKLSNPSSSNQLESPSSETDGRRSSALEL